MFGKGTSAGRSGPIHATDSRPARRSNGVAIVPPARQPSALRAFRANSIPLVAGPHPDRKPRGRGFLQTQSSETAGKPSLHFEESAGSGGSAPDAVALEWSRFGPARDTQRRQAAAVHALPQQRTAPGVYSVSELRQLAGSFEN